MTISPEALQNLRQNYKQGRLSENDCPEKPLELFTQWLKEAVTSNCDEPNSFTLSTIKEGRPAARILLLKAVSETGLTFFTNYLSPKGKQLSSQPFASATFLWLPLERQIRVEGLVEKVSSQESDEYFNRRPYGSRIGALASPQGEVVESREFLEKKFREFTAKYPEGSVIPRPENWGGYILKPQLIEFWQGRENRLHDRVQYSQGTQGWTKRRLAP